jgi:hypothetical protein
LRPEVG